MQKSAVPAALVTLAFLALGLAACGTDSGSAAVDAALPKPDANPLIAERPYEVQIPGKYDPAQPTPVLLLLHGYSVDGFTQVAYFQASVWAESKGWLLAYPDGTVDQMGNRFWNATDGCCNLYGATVDDVAYLTAVLDDLQARFNVDPKRIWLLGHSNGGFMSHRLACEIGDRIAGIVSLAGMTWKDPAKCPAAAKVNILQIHGTADQTIVYDGNQYYPSAPTTVALWAQKNGCTGALTDDAPLDLDSQQAGTETHRQHTAGCPAGGAVDFWTITGAGHIPNLSGADFPTAMLDWLEAHPKP